MTTKVPDIVVEFDRSTQSLGALREAAYLLLAEASCLIDTNGDRHICRLVPKSGSATDGGEIRTRFLDHVTDENLREKVSAETAGIRDVIIVLAFGALARDRDHSESR